VKLLSVGLTGTTDEVRTRLQKDCITLRQEGFRVAIDEINKGHYTFLGCNVIEGELSFRNYERIKNLLKNYVAEILAELIIEREENKLVKKIINNNYYYFNENERKIVFTNALEILNSDGGAFSDFNLAARHSKILSQIIEYLDHHHELVLEGFINFRLKEYRKRLVEIVDTAVDDYMMDLEYKEFIRVLRYFVDLQEPKVEEVHVVIGQNGNYKILDTSGNSVNNRYLDNFVAESISEINYEDLLITSLISISPYNIMLHSRDFASSQNVVNTIKNVFEGRVALCGGCHICTEL
jgi:putative sporulation protein YtxC